MKGKKSKEGREKKDVFSLRFFGDAVRNRKSREIINHTQYFLTLNTQFYSWVAGKRALCNFEILVSLALQLSTE
jgi:hypothetical protein